MISINVNNEKLLDELILELKLFYSQEEIENLNILFDINQEVKVDDIYTKLKCSLLEFFLGILKIKFNFIFTYNSKK